MFRASTSARRRQTASSCPTRFSLISGVVFDEEDERQRARENASLWYLCVYINGDDVRAELAFPRSIEERQFKDFKERIYVIKPGEWLSIVPKEVDNEPPAQDFEINVTRKK